PRLRARVPGDDARGILATAGAGLRRGQDVHLPHAVRVPHGDARAEADALDHVGAAGGDVGHVWRDEVHVDDIREEQYRIVSCVRLDGAGEVHRVIRVDAAVADVRGVDHGLDVAVRRR